MNARSKICLFSIGNAYKEAGGPRTRITGIAKALQEHSDTNTIILGNKFNKLKKTIRAPRTKLLYIESNTSFFKLIDFLCLLILRFKSKNVVVYIRDIYYELSFKEINTLKSLKDLICHKSANFFYSLISNEMAFPTIQMASIYFKKNRYYFKKPSFAFPPGTFIPKYECNSQDSLNNIKFLYLGSTKYQNSGFEFYISLAKELRDVYEFHILTPDDISETLISEFGRVDVENIKVLSLDHDQVLSYIHENRLTFAIHSRPRNEYDDITFPIKFMDFISCLLPTITFSHAPIVSLLGCDYPFYIKELTAASLKNCVDKTIENPDLYINTKNQFLLLRGEKLYINQIKDLESRLSFNK